MKDNPLAQSKDQYAQIIKIIEANSAVGIDAQYTHAIIIEYLSQLSVRVTKIENILEDIKEKLSD